MTIHLDRLPATFAVARLAPDAGWPHWATWSRDVVSVTRTASETSVICPAALVPATVQAERDFTAFAVRGPLPFSMVGVLSALSTPLAQARIPLLAISTYDTDILLVREAMADAAVGTWRAAGIEVNGA